MPVQQIDYVEVKAKHLVLIMRVDFEILHEVEIGLVEPGCTAGMNWAVRSEGAIRVDVHVRPLSKPPQVHAFDRRTAACQADIHVRANRTALVSTLEDAEGGAEAMSPR